jgi:ABC-type transport system involved in multi-copper enzyme maturation permease subunit
MILLPIIAREMRAAARQTFTYHLRTYGVCAVLFVGIFVVPAEYFQPGYGAALFCLVHLALLANIWILVPLLTMDCLSRERREGTLGLLFLTGLGAGNIVVAKVLAHGLRAITLWLSMLPAMAIPFLLGGVTRSQVLFSVSVQFSALCGALAAGLLASAHCKAWLRTLLLSAILAGAFAVLLAWLLVLLVFSGSPLARWDFESALEVAITVAGGTSSTSRWSMFSKSSLGLVMTQVTLFSVALLLFAILLAGFRIRRTLQEDVPSPVRLWWRRGFCTPILLRGYFQRRQRWKLDRNPVGWLQERTWTGRSASLIWLAVVAVYFSAMLSGSDSGRYSIETYELLLALGWAMVGSMAIAAVGSFRRERETGLMELLVTSALKERSIIWGRLLGLWGQFLLAAGLYLSVFYVGEEYAGSGIILFFFSTFLTLPVIGLYYSLRCRSFMVALVATLAVDLLAPMIWCSLRGLISDDSSALMPFALGALCQLILAAVCAMLLLRRLKQRAFPLGRQES